QRRRAERYAVARTHGRNAPRSLHDIGLGRIVTIERTGRRPTRENAGRKGRTDYDGDAALRAKLQLAVQRILLHERIRHGDEKEIDVEAFEKARDHADVIDARADRLDFAARLEIGERPI